MPGFEWIDKLVGDERFQKLSEPQRMETLHHGLLRTDARYGKLTPNDRMAVIEGIYKAKIPPQQQPEPGLLRKAAAYAVQLGLPIAGGLAGGPLGAMAGGGIGEYGKEKILGEPTDVANIGIGTVLPAIPAGAAAKYAKGPLGQLAAHALEGAGIGAAIPAAQAWLKGQPMPSAREELTSTGFGAGLGLLGGAAGKYLERGKVPIREGEGKPPPSPGAPPPVAKAPAATAAEAAAAKPVSGLTPEEIARLKKQGYPPELIARLEEQAGTAKPVEAAPAAARPTEKAKLRYDPKTGKLVPKEAAEVKVKAAPEPPASIKRMKNDKMAQNAYRMWLGSKEQIAKHGMSKEEVEQAAGAYRGMPTKEGLRAEFEQGLGKITRQTSRADIGGGRGPTAAEEAPIEGQPTGRGPTHIDPSDPYGRAGSEGVSGERPKVVTVPPLAEEEAQRRARQIKYGKKGQAMPAGMGELDISDQAKKVITVGMREAVIDQPRTWAQTRAEASSIGLTTMDAVKANLSGTLDQMIARAHGARQTLASLTDQLWGLAGKAANGTYADLHDFLWGIYWHNALLEEVRGTARGAGRMLNIFKAEADALGVPSGFTREMQRAPLAGGLYPPDAQKLLARPGGAEAMLKMLDKAGGEDQVRELARSMLKLNPEQRAQLAGKVLKKAPNGEFKLSDSIFWAYLNTRFGPLSWGRKLLGDSVMDVLHMMDTGAAGVIGGVRSAITGSTDRVYLREAGIEASAALRGVKAMVTDFGDSPMGSAFMKTLKGGGEAYTKAYPEAKPPKILEGTWLGDLFSAGPTIRPLQAINSALARNGYIMETERLAAREAIRAGKGGSAEQLRAAIDERLQQMGDRVGAGEYDELHEAGVKAAKYLTNTRNLGNFSRKINDVLGYKGLRYLFPVRHIPLNLVKTFIEHTPLALTLPDVWKEIYTSRAAMDMVMGRIAVGTGILGLAGWYAVNDKITGDGPIEPHKRATWALTHKSRSVNIGGKWYPLSAFEPATNFFVTAADYVEAGRSIDPKNKGQSDKLEEVFLRMVAPFIRDIASDTYFTTVKQVFEAIGDPSGRPAQQLIARLASNVVPAVVSQAARALDPWERETRGILDQLKAAIPYERQTLPIRPDVLGRPVPNQPTLGGSLVTGAIPVDKNPVAKELQNLGLGLMYVRPQPIKLANGRTAEYDKPALERYRQLYMQETQQAIQRVISLPSYNDWPKQTKQKLVRNARNAALRAVRAKMQPDIQRLTQGIKAEAPQE